MKITIFPLLMAVWLSGCVVAGPSQSMLESGQLVSEPVVKDIDRANNHLDKQAVPYPNLDAQTQIDALGLEVSRLKYHLNQLQMRVQQLERAQATPRRGRGIAAKEVLAAPAVISAESTTVPYQRAEQAYRAGQYTQVLNLLSGADTGGNGGDVARKSMFLYLQAHARLENCESVINIGQRFVTRFRGAQEAPEALYQVAECQTKMQQKDIARNTLRKLVQIYPDSNAAKKALIKLR